MIGSQHMIMDTLGRFMDEYIFFTFPVALIASVALFKRWRLAVLTIILLVLFEGALRKWVFPSLQAQIYFIKDWLLIVALAGFIAHARDRGSHEGQMTGLKVLLLVSLVYFSLQIANPNSPTPLVGLLGLKAYMLYVALLLMIPYVFQSRADLDRKLKRLMLIMIPIALLGLMQFALPASHWLNTYVQQDAEAAISVSEFGTGGRVRAAGTFSYIGGFGTFVVTAFNLAAAYALTIKGNLRSNWIAYALLLSSGMAIFTTGSRWVLLGTLGTLPFVLFLVMRSGLISSQLFLRLGGASLLMTAAITLFAGDAFDATIWRVTNADSNVGRALSPLTELQQAFEVSPVFGTGIGTNSNGSWTVAGAKSLYDAWWLDGHLFEVETARIMQEVGLFGFLLVYVVRLTMLMWAIKMVMRLRTPLYKALSACIAAFFLLHMGLFVIHNPTAGVFYWSAAGLLFAMYRLDSESTHRVAPSPQTRDGRRSAFAQPVVSLRGPVRKFMPPPTYIIRRLRSTSC
ncbi:O-antigen ligase family protein [Methylocystis sp.]|uniref:O-antigen ligase family protein n=1 Tax=Methylocystis sp. TaxID=1911079 RepID=UPI003DA21AF5